jgi:hypothetical protein
VGGQVVVLIAGKARSYIPLSTLKKKLLFSDKPPKVSDVPGDDGLLMVPAGGLCSVK